MASSFRRWLFGFLMFILLVVIAFGSVVVSTTSTWLNHVIGAQQEDVQTGLPRHDVRSRISWVGFMPGHAHSMMRFEVGLPHIESIRDGLATISFSLTSSMPTKDYPTLRVLLQDQNGSTVRHVDFAPSSYSHGDGLSSEVISLVVGVQPGERRISLQAMPPAS